MIIDCQDSDINLATTGVQADIERNVFTPVYHVLCQQKEFHK